MFSELPKLFDRNFAIGYFLPIVTFVALSMGILNGFGLSNQLLPLIQTDLLVGTTILGLASWIGGVLLLVANRGVFMLVEGYGRFNPAQLFMNIERWRYIRIKRAIERLKKQRDRQNWMEEELIRLRIEEARFPKESRLLPTAFGNTIRAFEEYPSVMYGIDAIEGWNRLLAVIPKDYRELIDTAKAQTDFWLNLWVLSFVVLSEYVGIALYTRQLNVIWIPVLTLAITWIASQRAKDSANEWGALVKASFDVYLPELYKKLGFPHPINRDEERDIWEDFSRAFLYKIPESMPAREKPKEEEKK